MSALLRASIVIVLMALMAACGVAPRAVVVDRAPSQRPDTRPSPAPGAGRVHIVQRGDTLYSIAFRHGLEYRQVAEWNGIRAPFTIYPGQRIRLSPRSGDRRPAATGAVAGAAATTPRAAPQAPRTSPAAPASGSTAGSPPSASGSAATTSNAPGIVSRPPAPPAAVPAPAPNAALRWQWPTTGQVVGRFVAGDPTRQGLSIAGNPGQAINAAADGVVVYSGSGLIGYGELIIIKHSDEFLSAYGHNRKRLVGEGESVRAGQQIAEMGRSGAARDMLHFEIRRNGRPTDPMAHLPAR